MPKKAGIHNNKFKERGIALVTLVITIIVLLILAGVTLNAIFGESGIISNAQKSKENMEISREKELIVQGIIIAETESKTGEITIEEIQIAMDKVSGENIVKAINFGESILVQFNESQRYYGVSEEGKAEGPLEIKQDKTPGALDGTGTEDDPYVIMSIEDLVYFSKQVYEKISSYAAEYIKLGISLDFNSELSYADYKTTSYDEFLGGDGTIGLKEQLTNGRGFRPIGENADCAFAGIFDGNNNTIYNIEIDDSDGYAGLFGITSGAHISNITVTGEIKGNNRTGGIVGWLRYGSTIQNCYNLSNIYGSSHTGGIAGDASSDSIVNCYNGGKIKLEGENSYTSVGGIAGVGGTIINCYNLGTVENYCTRVYAGAGGIMGNAINQERTILNCYNVGSVTGKYSQGAIVGGYWYDNWISILENCYYLEGSCNYPVGDGGIVKEGTISSTKNYMQSDEFINELNSFVNTYNEEHKTDEGFIELSNWEKGTDGYPTFVREEH